MNPFACDSMQCTPHNMGLHTPQEERRGVCVMPALSIQTAVLSAYSMWSFKSVHDHCPWFYAGTMIDGEAVDML